MYWLTTLLVVLPLLSPSHALKNHNSSSEHVPSGNQLEDDLTPDDASPNFYSSSSDDYSAFFDNFPDLNYFPEFGEIFRLSRTTTPRPPFRFPGYVRDAFPGDDYKTEDPPPRRRPPRPASSSSSRTKVSKGSGDSPPPRDKGTRPSSKGPAPKTAFPKIFRFTADRVNLADFDSRKKVNENYLALTKGDGLDSGGVARAGFLILHGGVFEIDSASSRSRS